MKKKILVLAFVLVAVFLVMTSNTQAVEISDERETAIINKCDSIKETLKKVQHDDSKARVYLGRYYETILNKFITPLNVRLVDNNLSDNNLIDNQNNFVNTRTNFIIDYIEYQKALESLVAMDCKTEPEKFYTKLDSVRLKRKVVSEDAIKLKTLAEEQVNLVNILKGTL